MEEDLDKLFKGANRIKSIDRKNPSKNKREDFESGIKARKRPEKGRETIRDFKEAEKPITEESIVEEPTKDARQTGGKEEKTKTKEDWEEKPEKVPTAVGIPTEVGKESKPEEKSKKEKPLTSEEK